MVRHPSSQVGLLTWRAEFSHRLGTIFSLSGSALGAYIDAVIGLVEKPAGIVDIVGQNPCGPDKNVSGP
jgi:hypothetical protein